MKFKASSIYKNRNYLIGNGNEMVRQYTKKEGIAAENRQQAAIPVGDFLSERCYY
jgi:hypothetical protein